MRGGRIVAVLALLGLLKVCLGALSFPFFGHMDELAHVDTTFKYASGKWPKAGRDAFERETLELFIMLNSGEYLIDSGGASPAPVAALLDWPSEELRDQHLEQQLGLFAGKPNHEAFETPPYYLMAGAMLHTASALGLRGLDALFFVRLLGGLMLAGAVVCSYLFLRTILPDREFLCLGVPMMLVAFPQDVFYFINNDVPFVLLFPLSLWLLVRLRTNQHGPTLWIVTGMLLAVTFVAKATNLTILVLAASFLASTLGQSRRPWLLVAGTALPLVAWHAYALIATDHLSTSFHKTETLGVSTNSWQGILDHPIFTADGAATFCSHLLGNFWRGETRWNGEVMHHSSIDRIMLWSTFGFAAVSLLANLRRRTANRLPRFISVGGWAAVLIGLAMMVVMSICWDFGNNTYPSKEFPYFVSGRLQNGMFVIVALFYLDGLEHSTRWMGRFAPWITLAMLLATLVVSELILMTPVVASPHNFWHLNV